VINIDARIKHGQTRCMIQCTNNLFSFHSVTGRTKRTVYIYHHRPGMYKKFHSVCQPSGLPARKSGVTGDRETSADDVGVPGIGLTATGPDACMLFVISVNLASI
jgi:hypothetical protein